MHPIMYTVNQLAKLADVSKRTLHYYDEIDLLNPDSIASNGYRQYGEPSLLRLQQIMFYRETGLELRQIKQLLDAPDFDLVAALRTHRQTMHDKITRLRTLIETVDATIAHVIGEIDMSKKNIFKGFSEEKQKQYEQQAIEEWGETAEETIAYWNSYSDERKEAVMAEGNAIYAELAENIDKVPDSPEVQTLLVRWHEHLRHFYEPSIEMIEGLGNMYFEHPDFNATFTAIDPALPAFLQRAIATYADTLETQWLERELNVLEESE